MKSYFFAQPLLTQMLPKSLTGISKSASCNLQPATCNLSPRRILIGLLLAIILASPYSSAAHWVAGYVENALDTTSPDGRTLRLWNPSNSQETLAIVGPSGPSGTPNVYMIDCELLATPCKVGDTLNLTIQNDASGYTAKNTVEVIVTGAGFDVAQNLSINTPPSFAGLLVEDSLSSPLNEIDLTPATTTQITCSGIASDYEGASSISTIRAEFFSQFSSFGNLDDNNNHYTNSSCQINTSYGTSNQAEVNCIFEIEYYAEAGSWACQFNITDNYSSSITTQDATNVNTLLAIAVDSPMGFGEMNAGEVSQEKEAQITNYGNVKMNLTLNGYGQTPLDGNAMECGTTDISIDYMKFNLTQSNSSDLTFQEFETIYQNLTSSPVQYDFNLNSRQNDLNNEANASTYWRVYLPVGVGNNCAGNIVFAATQS